jgi:hypothetical protein
VGDSELSQIAYWANLTIDVACLDPSTEDRGDLVARLVSPDQHLPAVAHGSASCEVVGFPFKGDLDISWHSIARQEEADIGIVLCSRDGEGKIHIT